MADALEGWRQRIFANRAQVERLREVSDGADFYATVTIAFRAPDPRQQHEPTLEVLRSLVRPGESVLDIGAGGGRFALPLALEAAEVVAVDPSEAMLRTLQDGAAQHHVENVRTIHAAWPMTDPPGADVTLAANVLYDIANPTRRRRVPQGVAEQIGQHLDGPIGVGQHSWQPGRHIGLQPNALFRQRVGTDEWRLPCSSAPVARTLRVSNPRRTRPTPGEHAQLTKRVIARRAREARSSPN